MSCLGGSVGFSKNKEGCAVVNARRITRRDGTLFFEGRFHLGQRFHGSGFRVLIGIKHDVALAAGNRDRHDLRLEAAFRNRLGGTVLRLKRKSILLFTGNLPLGGKILSSHTHVAHTKRIGKCGNHHVDHFGVAHACTRAHCGRKITTTGHAFCSATNPEITVTQHDGLRS